MRILARIRFVVFRNTDPYEKWVDDLKNGTTPPGILKKPPLGWLRRLKRSPEFNDVDPHDIIFMEDYYRDM